MQGSSFSSSHAHRGQRQVTRQSVILGWMLLSLTFIFLESCTGSMNTQGTQPQPPATTASVPTSITPQLTATYEFTENDSGKSLTYTVTSRFGMELDIQKYPKQNTRVVCTPPGAIGSISNIPSVVPPLYAVRYQAVKPGTCTITNGSFILKVKVINLPN